MEIKLTNEESEQYFFDAICNGLSYVCSGYDLSVDYEKEDYDAAKTKLQTADPSDMICYEDILMEILRMGKTITIVDDGCDGEYTKELTLEMIHNGVCKTPLRHLMDAINENGDADTADAIIQTVLYNDIIFG